AGPAPATGELAHLPRSPAVEDPAAHGAGVDPPRGHARDRLARHARAVAAHVPLAGAALARASAASAGRHAVARHAGLSVPAARAPARVLLCAPVHGPVSGVDVFVHAAAALAHPLLAARAALHTAHLDDDLPLALGQRDRLASGADHPAFGVADLDLE